MPRGYQDAVTENILAGGRAKLECARVQITSHRDVVLARRLSAPQAAQAHATSTSYLLIDAPRADGPVEVRWDLAIHDIVWNVLIEPTTTESRPGRRSATRAPSACRSGQLSLQRGGAACELRVTTSRWPSAPG